MESEVTTRVANIRVVLYTYTIQHNGFGIDKTDQ